MNNKQDKQDPYYVGIARQHQQQGNSGGKRAWDEEIVFNEDLKYAIGKAEKHMELERRIDSARRRRENMLFLRESRSRATNMRQADISKSALQQRWKDDVDRDRRAHALKQSTDEQVVLRKVSVSE